MNEFVTLRRFESQCEIARIYGLTWERLFATTPQSHVARIISLAEAETDTTPKAVPTEDSPMEGPLDEWEHMLINGDDIPPLTDREAGWIDAYHREALARDEHEEDK